MEHMDELLKNGAFVEVPDNEEPLVIPHMQECGVSKISREKF
jgi:hypothetical protein